MNTDFLSQIRTRESFLSISDENIPKLCAEIREFLIERVTENGGHLASNLGTVELSVALHRVFDPAVDHIIFDTGHQCYVHKMLSGRLDDFRKLRTPGGLSGFPLRKESSCDAFGTGHSATGLSAAIGFAEADALAGRDSYSVVVLGDGAYTSGMIHEALNNVRKNRRLIVILNENEMSISPNIGKFAAYLARIRASRRYVRTKEKTARFLQTIPLIGKSLYRFAKNAKRKLKNALYHSNYFEDLGLYYIGPTNGNDYAAVLRVLEEARLCEDSVLIHLKTVKGKGYAPAEEAPQKYHSLAPASLPRTESYFHTEFGKTLHELAAENNKIVAVTAAMTYGTGLSDFSRDYSDRFFDVGIAEEHALTFAAGLAAGGFTPFFAVYSTFLQRGYDNVLHDIALQNLPVKIAIDRAGLAVNDGATHHGIFDMAMLSTVPGIEIFTPATYGSMKTMIKDMTQSTKPQAIRYPNAGEDARVAQVFYPNGDFENYGVRADTEKTPDLWLAAFGTPVSRLLSVAEKLRSEGKHVGILLIEKPAPYAETVSRLLPRLSSGAKLLFYEESEYNGGPSMILTSELRARGVRSEIRTVAIRDSFVSPDSPCDPYRFAGISESDVYAAASELLDSITY